MKRRGLLAFSILSLLLVAPALGQITVLDQAQDAAASEPAPDAAPVEAAPPPICGTEPLSIARMNWPSAAVLAEIHARILNQSYGCTVRVTPGDLSATASSMGTAGQPAVAPEMWVTRVADLWNRGVEAQMVRAAAPSFSETTIEGWFMPAYMAGAFTVAPSAAGLAAALPELAGEGRTRFISCPADWACAVINRNLVRAHGLDELVELVEPANRLEMDQLIAEAVSRREFFLFYYWQPNAVLAQLDFISLDMGAYDEAAMTCLASLACATPVPSAFVADQVVMALAERVFTETPVLAGYFQRASMPLAEMNRLLAQLNEPGATPEMVAEQFVASRSDLWSAWVSNSP